MDLYRRCHVTTNQRHAFLHQRFVGCRPRKGCLHLSLIARCILFCPGIGLLFALQLLGQSANPFQGSVPSSAASPEPLALTLSDAIQRGLKTNLGLLNSETASQTARAER